VIFIRGPTSKIITGPPNCVKTALGGLEVDLRRRLMGGGGVSGG